MNNLSPEVSTRIETLIKTLSENVNNFTEAIGGTPAKYYKLIKGETKPNFDTLYEILNHWPQINGDWVLTGRGEMMGQPSYTSQPANDSVNTESAEGWKAYAGEKDKMIEKLSADLERERTEKSRMLNALLKDFKMGVVDGKKKTKVIQLGDRAQLRKDTEVYAQIG